MFALENAISDASSRGIFPRTRESDWRVPEPTEIDPCPVSTELLSTFSAQHMFSASAVTVLPETEAASIAKITMPARQPMRSALWERLMRFSRILAEDESATPVSPETLEHARRLLAELPDDIELPQTTISFEGEVIFTWFRWRDRLETFLAPDNYLTWASRIGDSIEEGDVVCMDDVSALLRFYEAVSRFYE